MFLRHPEPLPGRTPAMERLRNPGFSLREYHLAGIL